MSIPHGVKHGGEGGIVKKRPLVSLSRFQAGEQSFEGLAGYDLDSELSLLATETAGGSQHPDEGIVVWS